MVLLSIGLGGDVLGVAISPLPPAAGSLELSTRLSTNASALSSLVSV